MNFNFDLSSLGIIYINLNIISIICWKTITLKYIIKFPQWKKSDKIFDTIKIHQYQVDDDINGHMLHFKSHRSFRCRRTVKITAEWKCSNKPLNKRTHCSSDLIVPSLLNTFRPFPGATPLQLFPKKEKKNSNEWAWTYQLVSKFQLLNQKLACDKIYKNYKIFHMQAKSHLHFILAQISLWYNVFYNIGILSN